MTVRECHIKQGAGKMFIQLFINVIKNDKVEDAEDEVKRFKGPAAKLQVFSKNTIRDGGSTAP